MLAEVVRPYTDAETGEAHMAGERVELSGARLAELSGLGFVKAVKGRGYKKRAPARRGGGNGRLRDS